MLKTRLCDYSDACIPVKGTAAITGARIADIIRLANEKNEEVILKISRQSLIAEVKQIIPKKIMQNISML